MARPTFISAVAIPQGTSATPGPVAIPGGVPADAEGVIYYAGGYQLGAVGLTSVSGNFTGAWTVDSLPLDADSDLASGAYARVTSAPGSPTFSPVFDTIFSGGPGAFLAFYKDIPPSGAWMESFTLGHGDNTQKITLTGSSNPDCDAILFDSQDGGGGPPNAITGWTSRGTQSENGQFTRVSTITAAPGSPTTSVTTEGEFYASALLAIVRGITGGGTETDLTSADMVHAQALDAATLSTGVSVSPADLAHGQALDAVVLSTVVGLSPADLAHAQRLDAVALSSSTRLTLADMLQAHALESPTLSTALSLSLADLLHSQALDAVALSSSVGLVPADMAHGHALDAAVLSTVVGLALADLLHSHALDAVALSTDDATSLAVADMLQAHALESPALSSSVGLTVARLVHAQSLDAVTLGATLSLVVADLLHSHALDAVVLDNVPGLTVADLTHAHALESPALSTLATLVLADMLHAHRLDGVTLSGDAVDTEKALRVAGRPRNWGIEGTRRNWRIQ